MRLYPAIDVKDGACVRLTKGSFDNVKVYGDSPAAQAVTWEQGGADFIHMVDLDGASKGYFVNENAIKEAVQAVKVPIQLGGGIRSLKNIEDVLSCGVYRVILGTVAVKEPKLVKEAIRQFGAEHIVVGVDAKDGKVATHGWEQVSGYTDLEFCLLMKEMGVKTIVYTDISRDGMLTGPNIARTGEISDKTGIDIIASGGVSSIEDLLKIKDAGIHGAIIGKALYEGKFLLSDAIRLFR